MIVARGMKIGTLYMIRNNNNVLAIADKKCKRIFFMINIGYPMDKMFFMYYLFEL